MGLIHTPRTIVSICKGLLKRRREPLDTGAAGIGEGNRHVYQAKLGLFDVDYLGHMNNGTQHRLYRWWCDPATWFAGKRLSSQLFSLLYVSFSPHYDISCLLDTR